MDKNLIELKEMIDEKNMIDESNLWKDKPDYQELHLILIQFCDDNYAILKKMGEIERQLQKLNDEFKKSIFKVTQ